MVFVCVRVSSENLWKWRSDMCRIFLVRHCIVWSPVSCLPSAEMFILVLQVVSCTPTVLSYLDTHFTAYLTSLEYPKGFVSAPSFSWQNNSAPCPVGYFLEKFSSLPLEVYASIHCQQSVFNGVIARRCIAHGFPQPSCRKKTKFDEAYISAGVTRHCGHLVQNDYCRT